jgi:hypothetical protein
MKEHNSIIEAIKKCPNNSIILWDEAQGFIKSGFKDLEQAQMEAFKLKYKGLRESVIK